MKARIGIADMGREIEVEVDGREELAKRLEKAYGDGISLLWFKNDKGRHIGIPVSRIAFIELVESSDQSVGFGP